GYQVGKFPVLWAEWNGIYRDTVRSFWKSDENQASSLAYRLTGSSDLYGRGGRRPWASVNFVTAHDGFTLNDLVSYNEKHNEANGEDNRDGNDHNLSWSRGAEGPTDDPGILDQRERAKRTFLATLMFSLGVPMLLHGDELNRTQQGNNNAYCQDNELSWVDWNLQPDARNMLEFTKEVIRLRKHHPVFRRGKFFYGPPRSRRGSEGPHLVPSGRQGDDGRGLDQSTDTLLRPPAGRRRPRRARRSWPAAGRRHPAAADQCVLGAAELRTARAQAATHVGDAARHARGDGEIEPAVPARGRHLRDRGPFARAAQAGRGVN